MSKIEFETVRAGQPRPYADSEYEYKIISDMGENRVKEFCVKFLRPCSQTRQEWQENRDDPGKYFGGYYSFTKVAEGEYKYYKLEPYTG